MGGGGELAGGGVLRGGSAGGGGGFSFFLLFVPPRGAGARRLAWAELLRWVDAVAGDLHASGLRHGERVSVWLPNRAETVIVMLACARNGYIVNPSLHRSSTVAEILDLAAGIDADDSVMVGVGDKDAVLAVRLSGPRVLEAIAPHDGTPPERASRRPVLLVGE